MWLSTPSKCPENAKKQHELKRTLLGSSLICDHIAVNEEFTFPRAPAPRCFFQFSPGRTRVPHQKALHVRSTTTHDTHTSIVTIASGPMHLSGRGDGIRDRITHSNSNSSSRRERTQQLARQRYGREARARALMEPHGAHGAHVAERAAAHTSNSGQLNCMV